MEPNNNRPPRVTILSLPASPQSPSVSFSPHSPPLSPSRPIPTMAGKKKIPSSMSSHASLSSSPTTPSTSRHQPQQQHKKKLASRLSAPLDSPAFIAIRKNFASSDSPSSSSPSSPPNSSPYFSNFSSSPPSPSSKPLSPLAYSSSPSTPPLSLSSTPRTPPSSSSSTPRCYAPKNNPPLTTCSSTPAAGIAVGDCLSPRQRVEKGLKLSKIRRKSKSGRKSFLDGGLGIGMLGGAEQAEVPLEEEEEEKTKRTRANSAKGKRPASMLKTKIKKSDLTSPPSTVLSPALLGLKSPFQRKDERESLPNSPPPSLLFSKKDWEVSFLLQQNDHFLSLILLQALLSSSFCSSPVGGSVNHDWLMNIIIFMNHQHASLFLSSFSVELRRETNTATVMRERSASVRVLQYIWEQLDIQHIVEPLRKGGAELTKDIPLLTKQKEEREEEKETKKKSKLLKKIQEMIHNLLDEQNLPPIVPHLCWECKKTFSKVRAEQGVEEMADKQLQRWIVGTLYLLRFLIPKITNKGEGGDTGEAGRLLVGKLLMKLCSQSLFPSSSCVLSEFLLSAHPLFDSFCERVMEKGRMMSERREGGGKQGRSQTERRRSLSERGTITHNLKERCQSERGVAWGIEEEGEEGEEGEGEEGEWDLFIDQRGLVGKKEREGIVNFLEEHKVNLVALGEKFLIKRREGGKKVEEGSEENGELNEEQNCIDSINNTTELPIEELLGKLQEALVGSMEDKEEEESEEKEEEGEGRRTRLHSISKEWSWDEASDSEEMKKGSYDGVKRKKEKAEKRRKRVKSELGGSMVGEKKKREEGEDEVDEEKKAKKKDKSERRRGVKSELGGSGVEKKKGEEGEKGRRKRRDEKVRGGWGGGLEQGEESEKKKKNNQNK